LMSMSAGTRGRPHGRHTEIDARVGTTRSASRSGKQTITRCSRLSLPKEFRSRGGPAGRPGRAPGTGLIGIDFRHAVEFSRSGRAPEAGLPAVLGGNPSTLAERPSPGKPGRDPHLPHAPARRQQVLAPSRSFVGPPRDRPPRGVRSSLAGGEGVRYVAAQGESNPGGTRTDRAATHG
jgi:hypothetical protein